MFDERIKISHVVTKVVSIFVGSLKKRTATPQSETNEKLIKPTNKQRDTSQDNRRQTLTQTLTLKSGPKQTHYLLSKGMAVLPETLKMNQLRTIVLFLSMCLWNSPVLGQNLTWDGIDVSFLPQVEANGGVFKDGGKQLRLPTILTNHGVKVARLRLWHTPDGGINGLNYTLDLAKRLHDEGIKIMLNFHYSDTWADPAHQTKPKAWENLEFAALAAIAIRDYTKDSLMAFIARGILLIAVQIGNETPSGMLWPEGRVGGAYDTQKQWSQLGTLFKSAREGIVHLSDGGSQTLSSWFFNKLKNENVTFDVIGVSYYLWWHGKLSDLRNNLLYCVAEFGKDIAVIETSYPWMLQWFDNENNIVGLTNQLLQGYEATPNGQAPGPDP
jgi:arabinogalactan endo-1,4-beta-galactosidase